MLLDVRPGRPDHVYLSDFGLSKGSLAMSGLTGLTGSGQFIGTLEYISPEQIQGQPADGRADQYALACAAFELLAGEPPFGRDQGLAVVAAHLSAPPPPVSARRAGLPGGVDEVFARALAKAPSDRFATCGDFAGALRAALGLPPYDAGSADGPPRRTPTQVAVSPAMPLAVTPGPANSGPPGPGAGVPPEPQPGTGPGPMGVWAATVDASRAAVLPREPVPSPEPEPIPGQPTSGRAAPDKAVSGPDQARGWRPGRRVMVIAVAGAALAAAAIIAAVIALQPAPAGHQQTSTGPIAGPETAYVVSFGAGTVTPIDVTTGRAGTPIQPGHLPYTAAITPDGKTAYVAGYDGTVTPVDLATGRLGTPIPVAGNLDAIAITPDGKTAYVTSNGGVTPIDLATGRPGTPIRVNLGNNAHEIAITPDGKTAYVTNILAGTVTPIDLATGSVGTPIQVGDALAIAITPDGKTAYVTSDGGVTPIDLATGSAGTPIPAGSNPFAIAITPDGKTAYVADATTDGTVTPIDLATGSAGTPIRVGDWLVAIAITPDGKTAYVGNWTGDTVTPIDLATGRPGTPVQVGQAPNAIVITP